MNDGQRKAIRDKIKALLSAAAIPGIELHTFKKARLTGAAPAVCVYFERGESEGFESDGSLTVRVMSPDVENVDDVLDDIGDQVEAVLAAHINLDGVCQFTTRQGFEYDRDETEGWTALDLAYGVNF